MIINNPQVFFAGDFVLQKLEPTIASAIAPVGVVFGSREEAPDNCDFIFVGDKNKNTIEIVDPQQQNTIKIKAESQSIEDATAVVFASLYGAIYVGMDWCDIYQALSGGTEPVVYIGGVTKKELLQIKAKYENAKGIFLYIKANTDATLDEGDKDVRECFDFLKPDVDFVWTLSFDKNLKDTTYYIFIKN